MEGPTNNGHYVTFKYLKNKTTSPNPFSSASSTVAAITSNTTTIKGATSTSNGPFVGWFFLRFSAGKDTVD